MITKEQYEEKLKRIEEIMDCAPNTPEANELDLLCDEIEEYEGAHFNSPKINKSDLQQYNLELKGKLKFKN